VGHCSYLLAGGATWASIGVTLAVACCDKASWAACGGTAGGCCLLWGLGFGCLQYSGSLAKKADELQPDAAAIFQ
jgi:hypothetical protein